MARSISPVALYPRALHDLLDLAFQIYRQSVWGYLSIIAFSFLGLCAFGLNYLHLERMPFDSWVQIYGLGATPPAVSPFRAAFGREFFFADGALFWNLAAMLLTPVISRAYIYGAVPSSHELGTMSRGNIWLLALAIAAPIMALRMLGIGYLVELLRLPAMFAPYILIIERASIGQALGGSWRMVRQDLPRALAMFGVVLLLVRLATLLPFASLQIINRTMPALLPQPGVYLLPLALLGALLAYPVAHIAVMLLYYDLRIRREGLDLALAARRQEEEARYHDDRPAVE